MSACSPADRRRHPVHRHGNGVDEGHINIPAPEAPSFIALDKKTGKLIWKNNAPGKNIMHGQWSNPVYAVIGGVPQVIFPGGDGWLYVLRARDRRADLEVRLPTRRTPSTSSAATGTQSDFIGTPVVHDGKVYIGVGQDPEHITGIGHFWCIDPTKKGDISPSWPWRPRGTTARRRRPASRTRTRCRRLALRRRPTTGKFVAAGLQVRPDHEHRLHRRRHPLHRRAAGLLHCLDAKTGKQLLAVRHQGARSGARRYYVDGKVSARHRGRRPVRVQARQGAAGSIDDLDSAKDAPDMKDARKLRIEKQKAGREGVPARQDRVRRPDPQHPGRGERRALRDDREDAVRLQGEVRNPSFSRDAGCGAERGHGSRVDGTQRLARARSAPQASASRLNCTWSMSLSPSPQSNTRTCRDRHPRQADARDRGHPRRADRQRPGRSSTPTSARSSAGTSTRRPARRSGWRRPRRSTSTRSRT